MCSVPNRFGLELFSASVAAACDSEPADGGQHAAGLAMQAEIRHEEERFEKLVSNLDPKSRSQAATPISTRTKIDRLFSPSSARVPRALSLAFLRTVTSACRQAPSNR
jgi:hypothetical protein